MTKHVLCVALAVGCAHSAATPAKPVAQQGPYVVAGSEDFALKLTPRAGEATFRPEMRIALEVRNVRGAEVWVRVEKDGYTLGQTPIKAGVATLSDTAVPLEGAVGEGWYKIVVEEIISGQRYPIKWYQVPVTQTDSTSGRVLAIHPSYFRKHADLRDGTLRFVVAAPLEQAATQVVTEWVYNGRLVGEVARRWELPPLWVLQPLVFPLRAQLRAPYQLTDGRWDVIVFRDGAFEMHCPFVVTQGRYPGRLECKQDQIQQQERARMAALRHEIGKVDEDRAMQVRALVHSVEARRALVKEDQRDQYLQLVKKYGATQASTPSQP
jgi:hypothetical protein